MAGFVCKYDSLQLANDDANGFSVDDVEIPDDTRIPHEIAPRRHGAIVTEEEVQDRRIIAFSGRIKKTDSDAMRTSIDAVLKVMNGTRKRFYLYDTTRYINATKSRFTWNFVPGTLLSSIRYDAEVFCSDPFWYDPNTTSHVQAASGWPTSVTTWSPTNPGSVLVYPTITIANNIGGGSISNFTLTNTTTGKSITFSGTVTAGNSLVIDCANLTIRNNGTLDMTNWSGVFLWLVSGANDFSFSGANATITIAYQARFFGP